MSESCLLLLHRERKIILLDMYDGLSPLVIFVVQLHESAHCSIVAAFKPFYNYYKKKLVMHAVTEVLNLRACLEMSWKRNTV